MAHRNDIGDRDGAELHREAATGGDALRNASGNISQRHIARGDLVPRRCDPDLGLGEVRIRHAQRPQHSAVWGAISTLGDKRAARVHRHPSTLGASRTPSEDDQHDFHHHHQCAGTQSDD